MKVVRITVLMCAVAAMLSSTAFAGKGGGSFAMTKAVAGTCTVTCADGRTKTIDAPSAEYCAGYCEGYCGGPCSGGAT